MSQGNVAAAEDAQAFQSATIVVVDDEPTTVEMIEMFLEAQGYENVVALCDSSKAVETIRRSKADLVLLDLMMPDVGGLDILRTLAADEVLSSIPVVIFSSTTDREAKLEALELGAAEFLAKPVDPSELALRVRNTLAYRAYQQRFGHKKGAAHLLDRMDRALRRSGPMIRSRLGSDPRYRPTIERFVARLDERLDWMEKRLENEQFEELATLAHWLKGSATMVGFEAFSEPADTLEILAKKQRTEEAQEVLEELHSLAERIVVDDGTDD